MMRLLLLAGTAEARQCAAQLADLPGVIVTASFAGATRVPADLGVPTRVGGFGGVDGLRNYLITSEIDAVIDATHPFATQITHNATLAVSGLDVPLLHIDRPAWEPRPPELWISVPDIASAVEALPRGARVFTATGRGSLDYFLARDDIYTCLRVMEDQSDTYPGNGEFVVARPPFSVDAEVAVLKHHAATHLLVKNAGGAAGRTKLTAAGKLFLPIIVVDRQPLPDGAMSVSSAEAALSWLQGLI